MQRILGSHRTIILLTLLAVLSIMTWCVARPLYELFYQPLLSKSQSSMILEIPPAMSARAFARLLQEKHLIRSARTLRYCMQVQGLAAHLKKGIYQINQEDTAKSFVQRVVEGDILVQKIRILEGSTQQQVNDLLARTPYLITHDADWSVMHHHHLSDEGLLLADTYIFEAGSSRRELLKRAHDHLQENLDRIWAHRDSRLPYKNPYELLIAASIIEKEAALPLERRLISGVIVNRLHRAMPLQMDPTVLYALGPQHTGLLKHQDLAVESPYNSYKHRGLPPTPIAMISLDALRAAAHPMFSQFLYFVAKGDGTHQFSVTYAQQRQAIDRLRNHA